MAKKFKPGKRTRQPKHSERAKRKASDPLVTVESDFQVSVRLADWVAREPETVRGIAHRVVDVMVDNGLHEDLEQSIANNLSCVLDRFAADGVTALIHEAQAAGKEAARG